MNGIKKKAINMAILESVKNARNNYRDGGPFGAVIVRGDEIISHAHNTVIKSKDPTAHAEINAIRMAAKKLDTHDLSGCVLYTSAEPCPMCLSAIVWANIREVYYANSREDTEDIGFRDDKIYEYIKGNRKRLIKLNQIKSEDAKKIFDDFISREEKSIY